jgi:hypothetical protein
MTKPIDIMVDIETLGVSPGCKILEIAAIPFGGALKEPLHSDITHIYPSHYFNERISRLKQAGLHEESKTLDWWHNQDKEIQERVFNGIKSLTAVLREFSEFIEIVSIDCNVRVADIRLWGNSAAFDLGILKEAYVLARLPIPWNHSKEMCFRTLKNLYPNISHTFVGNKHMAYDDAYNQAVHAELILGTISPTYRNHEEDREELS